MRAWLQKIKCSFQAPPFLSRRLSCTFRALFLLLFTAFLCGASLGWLGRESHERHISGNPIRWHSVGLVGVVDGDTIKVKWEGITTSVRMLNINSPEREQSGYHEATASLRSQLAGTSTVTLEFEHDGQYARDHFGRLLCYVWLNGRCLNVEQVRRGHAVYWTKYGNGKYPDEFAAAAVNATRNKPLGADNYQKK